jgi:hypothetical protein
MSQQQQLQQAAEQVVQQLLAQHNEARDAWNEGLAQIEADYVALAHRYAAAAQKGHEAMSLQAQLASRGHQVDSPVQVAFWFDTLHRWVEKRGHRLHREHPDCHLK